MSNKFTDETTSSKSNIKNPAEKKVESDLFQLLHLNLDFVRKSFEAVKEKASELVDEVDEAHEKFENLAALPEGTATRNYQLRELIQKVSKLKFKIPFKLIIPPEQPNPHIHRRSRSDPNIFVEITSSSNSSKTPTTLPHYSLARWKHDHELLSRAYRDFCPLQELVMVCLLAFPENAVIKRSILYNWVYTFEAITSICFDEAINGLMAKRYVERVYKPNLTLAGYRVYSSVYSVLKLNKNSCFMNWSSIRENCFAPSLDEEKGDIYYTAESCKDILSPKLSLEMLYLGRWNDSTLQHIDVVIDPNIFFKDMSKLSLLKFVSLRGISMIQELPEFITKLKWLQILDLKACYDLEVIPSSISNLQHWLIHLDMSECYLLDHMPKSIAMLVQLKVLKGFFVGENQDVGNSCSLEDLVSLKRLEKLNIYTSVRELPNKSQLKVLESLANLINLTISWGGCSTLKQTHKSSKGDEETAGSALRRVLTKKGSTMQEETFKFNLWKLDLQCVPEAVTRSWLKPTNFEQLKKLYIRGGQFNDLSQEGECHKWNNVEILRLKHLSKLKLDWSELHRLFPKLSCLEKVNCPNLDGFPCDDKGVWPTDEWLRSNFRANYYKV